MLMEKSFNEDMKVFNDAKNDQIYDMCNMDKNGDYKKLSLVREIEVSYSSNTQALCIINDKI